MWCHVDARWRSDGWRGRFDLPLLPRNQRRRFAGCALSVGGDIAFSGEILATLTAGNQSLQVPLAAAQDGQTFHLPQRFRIVDPATVFAGAASSLACLRS